MRERKRESQGEREIGRERVGWGESERVGESERGG